MSFNVEIPSYQRYNRHKQNFVNSYNREEKKKQKIPTPHFHSTQKKQYEKTIQINQQRYYHGSINQAYKILQQEFRQIQKQCEALIRQSSQQKQQAYRKITQLETEAKELLRIRIIQNKQLQEQLAKLQKQNFNFRQQINQTQNFHEEQHIKFQLNTSEMVLYQLKVQIEHLHKDKQQLQYENKELKTENRCMCQQNLNKQQQRQELKCRVVQLQEECSMRQRNISILEQKIEKMTQQTSTLGHILDNKIKIENYNKDNTYMLQKQFGNLCEVVDQITESSKNCPKCFTLERQNKDIKNSLQFLQKEVQSNKNRHKEKQVKLIQQLEQSTTETHCARRQNRQIKLGLRQRNINYIRNRVKSTTSKMNENISRRCKTLVDQENTIL